MLKKLLVLLSALFLCSTLSLPCYGEENRVSAPENSDNTYNSTVVRLLDYSDLLTDEEEDEILSEAEVFAKRSGFNVGIVIANDIGEDKSDEAAVRFSEDMYNTLCGNDTDGLLLLINDDTTYDNIYRSGACKTYYSNASLRDTFIAVYDEWDENGLKSGLLCFVEKIGYYYNNSYDNGEAVIVAESEPTEDPEITEEQEASEGPVVKILDPSNYLTAPEESGIIKAARSFSEKSGFNIIFVITDDIGSDKSDRGVMNYADDRYDELCGINTDGILLLINNDTKYDWISTSGLCINYYSDERIDRIFDRIYDSIVSGDYFSACMDFVDKIESYYNQGKANNQVGIAAGNGFVEVDPENAATLMFIVLVFSAIVGVVIYNSIASRYKLKKSTTTNYAVRGSLLLTQNETVSKGFITTRVYSPRSSGSGGRGGHSSTHRSSGGGRHGGGGRRR